MESIVVALGTGKNERRRKESSVRSEKKATAILISKYGGHGKSNSDGQGNTRILSSDDILAVIE